MSKRRPNPATFLQGPHQGHQVIGSGHTRAPMPNTDIQISINSSMDERTPLIVPRPTATDQMSNIDSVIIRPAIVLYKRRWYILLLFSSLAFLQGLVWNTWGPIAASAKVTFGWTDADIALQANWGTITYVISAVFFAWLLDVKGIRIACVLVAILIFVGTALRCIPTQPPTTTWLINIASILNGFGGPVAMATPPLLSATWFPVNERTRATAFACAMSGLGVAVSFVAGPMFVHLPSNRTGVDMIGEVDTKYIINLSNASTYTKGQIAEMEHGITTYMYAQFGVVAVVTLGVLVYFPARPPTPPSISAGIERVQFVKGIKDLLRIKGFWILGGACGLSSGVFNVWTALIDVNLNPLGISENTAGFIAFTGVVAGNVIAVVISIFADVFAGKLKSFLIFLYTVGSVAFGVFALECAHIIPVHIWIFYVTMIIGSLCLAGATPLLYELTCEETYPVAEGLTGMGVTLLNNLAGLVFLLMFLIPMQSMVWMNWTVFVCTVVCVPVFAAYRPSYLRLHLDKTHDT